jgi:hypothetical protein
MNQDRRFMAFNRDSSRTMSLPLRASNSTARIATSAQPRDASFFANGAA